MTDNAKWKAKRIRAGKYLYRGFEINCIYNYEPEGGRNVWECVDKDGSGFGHSFTLREAKREIDWELERERKRSLRHERTNTRHHQPSACKAN